MYRTIVIEKPAHIFPNGEIFVSVADISINHKTITWRMPCKLKQKFEQSFSAELNDPLTDTTISVYSSWFDDTIGLKQDTIIIDVAVYYIPGTQKRLWSDKVIVSNSNTIPTIRGIYTDIFHDPNQLSTAYIIDNKIVSIAFDNGNGAVTIETQEQYQNRGYATECLSRLLFEYNNLSRKLGLGTKLKNKAAIRTAEKCGMKRTDNFGYWVRISPEKSKELEDVLVDWLE